MERRKRAEKAQLHSISLQFSEDPGRERSAKRTDRHGQGQTEPTAAARPREGRDRVQYRNAGVGRCERHVF